MTQQAPETPQQNASVDSPRTDPAPPAPDTPDAAQLRARLEEAEARLATTQRRHALEAALREAGAVDVEAAAILIEAARTARSTAFPGGGSDVDAFPSGGAGALPSGATGGGTDVDAATAVRDLKARRPFLFGAVPSPASSAGSAMSPAVTTTADAGLRRAADEARGGDPNAVLRYMRLRREAN
jgi:hypothetical protein